MKKSDLKTGMIVETISGDTALVMLDNCYGKDALIISDKAWAPLSCFNEDLLWNYKVWEQDRSDKPLDIIRVYEPDLPTGFLSRKNSDLTPIWERRRLPEYTMDDLIKMVGPFKLVK